MDFAVHNITDRIIDQSMPLNECFVLKNRGNDGDDKVTAATGGAGMTGMLGTLVDDVELHGLQFTRQALAQQGCTVGCHFRVIPF